MNYSSPAHRRGIVFGSPGHAFGNVQSWNRHAHNRPNDSPMSGWATRWWTSCQQRLTCHPSQSSQPDASYRNLHRNNPSMEHPQGCALRVDQSWHRPHHPLERHNRGWTLWIILL